ncbi:hypothetical protein E2562_023846 [Oryza meyeriana var. granulata]|uniref:Uncharacterized protein n=1 Tax=Oryza meyeriana var. granulata TaxID=110450 RepID=A0A6G1D7V7_9ORYZ|nr:hypothetical protein E2562_023846 [Oryza meyeriana var. granulata]
MPSPMHRRRPPLSPGAMPSFGQCAVVDPLPAQVDAIVAVMKPPTPRQRWSPLHLANAVVRPPPLRSRSAAAETGGWNGD